MRNTITYRPWQPGDDNAVWELLSTGPFNISRDYYEKKFNDGYLIKKRWASQNFPVYWNPEYPEVHVYNMKQYRVLRREESIVGYAKWNESSKYHPQGLVRDPMVLDEEPMAVIASVQAAIPAPRAWKTAVGSRYENPLRSLGCTLQPTEKVEMLLSFGPEIDWIGLARTRPFW